MPDIRRSLIILQEPVAPDAVPPICKWCGEEIEYTSWASGYRKTREYHRGDKYEIGNRNCRREHKQSFCWSGRDALRWQAARQTEGRATYRLFCVDCGEVCEEGRIQTSRKTGFHVRRRVELKPWHADHQVPVIDGGPHTLENLRCRCTDCHGIKTKQEAIDRAARREKVMTDGAAPN